MSFNLLEVLLYASRSFPIGNYGRLLLDEWGVEKLMNIENM